jgi:uncharacterized membrane protein YhaH (DUF805 family)
VSTWQWYVRRGRIDRRTWWLQYALPLAVLSVLGLFADLALGNSDLQELATGQADYGPIVTAVAVVTLPASISGSVTRLHDRGLPAWVLLIVFVPILGQIALLVLTGFVRGEARPNRYGPQPGPPPAPPAPLGDGPLYVPPTWK